MNKLLFKLTPFIGLLCSMNASAQNFPKLSDVRKDFPNEKVISVQQNGMVDLSVSKGKLKVLATIHEQNMQLDSTANLLGDDRATFVPSFFTISKLEAASYIPAGDKFKKMKVKSFNERARENEDGIFYDDTKTMNWHYSGVEEGVVVESKCTYSYTDPDFLFPFYFKNGMAGYQSTYAVTFDKNVEVGYKLFGDTSGLTFTSITKKGKTTYTWSYGKHNSIEYFSDGPSPKTYLPHIFVFVKSYLKNGEKIEVSGTPKLLFDKYKKYIEDLNLSKADKKLVAVVDSIKSINSNTDSIIKNIFYYVQSKIKYVAFEDGLGGFVPREANDVFEKKYGDCKDKASLLKFMLEQAGIKSSLVWVGSNTIPYTYNDLPLPAVDNHMIAAVKRNGEWIYLDGTADHLKYGMPSSFIQGKECLIELNGKDFEIQKIPVIPADKNYQIDSLTVNLDGENLKGEGVMYIDGYVKADVSTKLLYTNKKNYDKEVKGMLRRGNNKCDVKKYSISGVNNRDSLAIFKFNFEINGYGHLIGNEYFVNLNLQHFANGQEVDTTKREIGVQIDDLASKTGIVILNIPKGYDVKRIPQNFTLNTPDIQLSVTYVRKGNQIIRTEKLVDLTGLIPADRVRAYNKALEQMCDAYRELVVLKKLN